MESTTSVPSYSEVTYWQPEPSTYNQYYSENSTARIPQLHQGHSASCHDSYHTESRSSKVTRNHRSQTIIEDLQAKQLIT